MCKNQMKLKKMTTALLLGGLISLTAAGSVAAADNANMAMGPGYQSVETQEEPVSGHWLQNEGSWYYYNPDGTPGYGWIIDKDKYYYLTDGGLMLTNSITPDGYFVDANGEWNQRKTTIFNQEFTAPTRFPAAYSSWVNTEELARLRTQIRTVFKERRLKVSDNAIEYVVTSDNKERVLLGVYQLSETGSFRMDIGISLDASSIEPDEPETYDYMVFRAMMYEITSTPDHLEKAIYSSWEESNTWNIGRDHWTWLGDSLVMYSSSSGYGQYNIYPAQP